MNTIITKVLNNNSFNRNRTATFFAWGLDLPKANPLSGILPNKTNSEALQGVGSRASCPLTTTIERCHHGSTVRNLNFLAVTANLKWPHRYVFVNYVRSKYHNWLSNESIQQNVSTGCSKLNIECWKMYHQQWLLRAYNRTSEQISNIPSYCCMHLKPKSHMSQDIC